jgi:hypothetical protein
VDENAYNAFVSRGADSTADPAVSDAVIDAYKKDVDRTLLRENLRLTPDARVRNLIRLQRAAEEMRRAGRALRRGK